MFHELIQNEKPVIIYYGNESDSISGVIKKYNPEQNSVQLDSQDTVLSISNILKIEIINKESVNEHSLAFCYHQPLTHEADFDNALFLATPVSVWKNEVRIQKSSPLEANYASSVCINSSYYLKNHYTFKVDSPTFKSSTL